MPALGCPRKLVNGQDQWVIIYSIYNHGNFSYPPQSYPPRNKGLIRHSEGKPMVNKPLIRPYFLGGVALGGVARIPLI